MSNPLVNDIELENSEFLLDTPKSNHDSQEKTNRISKEEIEKKFEDIDSGLKAIYWMGAISCCATVISTIGIVVSLLVFFIQESRNQVPTVAEISEIIDEKMELNFKVNELSLENKQLMYLVQNLKESTTSP